MRTKKAADLQAVLDAENKKLKKLLERQSAIADQIKKTKANIAQLEMMKNSTNFSVLAEALASKGMNVEDVMAALANGDFLALQEKMESATPEEAADSETAA